MTVEHTSRRRWRGLVVGGALMAAAVAMPAQQMVTETRDPAQSQDEEFARLVKEWTPQSYFMSPLVDHLPKVTGIPAPNDVLGYHIGAPRKLTYYADSTTARSPPPRRASRWRRSANPTRIKSWWSSGYRRTRT
jgi:hypothetical protein